MASVLRSVRVSFLLVVLALGVGAGSLVHATEALASEPFVVERLDTVYRFEADGTGSVSMEVAARIHSDAAVQQLGQQLFPYVESRETVSVDYVEVRRPDGEVVRGAPDLVQHLPSPVSAMFPMYTDTKILHVTMPALRPGDLLTYKIHRELRFPEAEGDFWAEHQFERQAAVLAETLTIDLPGEVAVAVHAAPAFAQTTKDGDGRRVYRWTWAETQERVSFLEVESEDEARDLLAADVLVSSYANWPAVGDWYKALAGERAGASKEIAKRAKDLLEGVAGDRARVKRLYDFVSREFRYLGLSYGMGRYQPHPAEETLENGYGDCKDKHTLLSALLIASGYENHPVLVSASRDLAGDVPAPSQFDHMITAVRLGEETLFLDTTSQVAPFEYLPPALRGQPALLVSGPGQSRLVALPQEAGAGGYSDYRLTARVEETGTLTGEVIYRITGDNAFALRSLLLQMPRAEWGSVLDAGMRLLGVAGVDIDTLEVSELTEVDDPLELRFRVSRSDYVSPFRDRQVAGQPLPTVALLATGEEEVDPLELHSQPMRAMATATIELPGYLEAKPPIAIDVARDFATYRSSYSVVDGQMQIERELDLRSHELSRDSARAYTSFRSSVHSDFKQTFTLTKKGDGPSLAESDDVEQLYSLGRSALKRDDHAAAELMFARIAEIAPEDDRAWYQLTKARYKLDDWDGAIAAARRQVEVDPYHEDVRDWLAPALEKLDQDDEAERVYREQLDLFPLNQYANSRFGRLLYLQNRWEEATVYLERAVSIKASDHAARRRLGGALLKLERTDEGEAALSPLADAADHAVEVRKAAILLADHGRHESGLKLARRAHQLDPEDRYARFTLGRTLGKTDAWAESIAVLEALVEDHPDYVKAWRWLGNSRRWVDDLTGAEAAFRTALELEPDSEWTLDAMVQLLERGGRLAAALEFLKRLQTVSSDDHRFREAWLRGAIGDASGADRLLTELVEESPKDVDLRFVTAMNHYRQGDLEGAVGHLKRGTEYDPDWAQGHDSLATLQFELGNKPEAAASARKALALDDSRAASHRVLGLVLVAQSAYAEAVQHLERFKEIAGEQFADQDMLDFMYEQLAAAP